MKKSKKIAKKSVKKEVKKSASVKKIEKGNLTNNSVSLFPKVKPLGSRILIKPFTKEELENNSGKNSFGIILPDSDSKEKSEQGKVLAVGPGEWREGKLVAPEVNPGDIVAFSKYGYDDIKVDGEEYYLIKEENILAILK
jgi:chaperonin GroES